MPSNLFEYHTMGLSPMPGEADESCRISSDQQKCSSYWLANKCVVNYSPGQGITSVQCPPKITTPPPTGGTGPLCNPSSVGNRFSFNFPSGKKWTLSKADDARARAFYCGVGPVVQNPTPMDAIYCTGGEGAWDGTPTYWMSSARKGCKTNNQGESMPYGQMISREEYDRRGRTLCADGTYDENLNPWESKCQGNGGIMGSQPKMVCPVISQAFLDEASKEGKMLASLKRYDVNRDWDAGLEDLATSWIINNLTRELPNLSDRTNFPRECPQQYQMISNIIRSNYLNMVMQFPQVAYRA